ncbi:MAG: hypothetical protein JW791_03555 [Nanoarchaeota archaeon]|nr:hypothetical protein [Nanoarchaeota archaeon]
MKKEYKIHGLFEVSALATATAVLPLAAFSTDPAAVIAIAYVGSTIVHQFVAYFLNVANKLEAVRNNIITEYRK